MRKLFIQIVRFFKNPFTYFKKRKRKLELEKRDKAYTDVFDILAPINQKRHEDQLALIDKIKANFEKDTGVVYGSKFIPTKGKNSMHIIHIVMSKYGEEMNEKRVTINQDLILKCI